MLLRVLVFVMTRLVHDYGADVGTGDLTSARRPRVLTLLLETMRNNWWTRLLRTRSINMLLMTEVVMAFTARQMAIMEHPTAELQPIHTSELQTPRARARPRKLRCVCVCRLLWGPKLVRMVSGE